MIVVTNIPQALVDNLIVGNLYLIKQSQIYGSLSSKYNDFHVIIAIVLLPLRPVQLYILFFAAFGRT